MKINQILKVGLVMAFSLGLGAAAQDWYHDRDARFHGEAWRAQVFASVRDDLDHIYSVGATSDKEKRRLDKTKEELTALQSKLDQGVFDNGTLNDVIDSLRKSANDDRLGPRDREVISDDVARLHDYQANHNHWLRK
ncbi:MAG TPA: hypothetical protein VHZ55_01670 [Bryobacteraceae bacterium]|jgi:uncharacterized coiled-coil DUF342 family protein|nr:hypothetical protein [Bryobacteraceae bacterium]